MNGKQEEIPPTERYNRYVHLDQIAEWERKAIEKIRKQADEARRPLIAPPTPVTQTSPSTILVNELNYAPLTRLLTHSSNLEKQVLINHFIFYSHNISLISSHPLLINMNYYQMKH